MKGQLVYTEKHIFIFNLFNGTFTSNENSKKQWTESCKILQSVFIVPFNGKL